MLLTDLVDGFYKSGGFAYISTETNEVLIGFADNDIAKDRPLVIVPCRAMNKVSPELKPFCVSAVDPERPGWYLVHRDGKVVVEPEYDPQNPETFDDDASGIAKSDLFFKGFGTYESISLPNHYIHAGRDRELLSELQNTTEFLESASIYVIDRSRKGTLAFAFIHSVSSVLLNISVKNQPN